MTNLIQALGAINPDASYETWLNVGMALKYEGYTLSVWEDWSRNGTKYHPGECEKKWAGFNGSTNPVTGGTIYEYAKQAGWVPAPFDEGGALGWDDVISDDGDAPAPKREKTPNEQLIEYLKALYDADDIVGYNVDAKLHDDGKWKPEGWGVFTRTAGDLIASLQKHPDNIAWTVGDWIPQAGAWIHMNPYDGKGINDANITRYQYALIECDNLPIDEQIRLYREHRLPIAALTESAGKSVHAVVHVDANDREDYRARVSELHAYLQSKGIQIDTQNKNPSRLTRMPGATRNGKMQRLLGTNLGCKSWGEWREWVKMRAQMKKPIQRAEDIDRVKPPLKPEQIEGILRLGHKMLVTSSSKAGKSFLMLDLAIALANGREWLGHKCMQGDVLYVNLEIDDASLYHRLDEIYTKRGYPRTEDRMKHLWVWNLRGEADTLDQLRPELVRQVSELINSGVKFSAIILDPLYKIEMGDENSASDMAKFFNEFDKIANETGCSVISVHHHSKGAQGAKSAMDRGSGSGVFARDPDAILDIVELVQDQHTRNINSDYPDAHAFRIESILREFKPIEPVDFWFVYPVAVVDTEGVLKGLGAAGSIEAARAQNENNASPEEKKENYTAQLNKAYCAQARLGEDVTVRDIAEYMKKSEKTVRRYIEKSDEFKVENSVVTPC